MAVLLTVGNSEGERRCDAKCYNAKEPRCDCVCGGRNHGVGLAQAVDNVRDDWLGEDNKEKLIAAGVLTHPVQLALFRGKRC